MKKVDGIALDHYIRWQYVLRVIRWLMPEKVLDLGCGCLRIEGQTVKTPVQKLDFPLYVGVDASHDLTEKERPNFKLVTANYEEPLDIEEEIGYEPEFDLVLWLEGPEHTLKHRQVFENIHKLCAREGFLIITCPNQTPSGPTPNPRPGYSSHRYRFDFEALKKLVTENGFTILEIAEVYSKLEKTNYNWLYCLATNVTYDPRYADLGE